MSAFPRELSRRSFVTAASVTAGCGLLFHGYSMWAEDEVDQRVAKIVAATIGIDTHNHVDVPLTAVEQPGLNIDLKGEIQRSGLSAICMTFATDYQRGDPYDRFLKGLAAMDRQLEFNGMRRSLNAADVRTAHSGTKPTVIQAVEGAHFLEGHLDRLQEAYGRGLRHFGLLHDSDASVPLGDVYTNNPQLGGLTAFGVAVIKECNRLGMVIDLAHANAQTTQMALKVSTRPVVISHTGLDTRLGTDTHMAQMMRPRLISKGQARMVADSGGAVGVWMHLADTPLAYAENIRALVDVIGMDHVCIGTDTKLTQPGGRPGGPPPGQKRSDGPESGGPIAGGPHPGPSQMRTGERTNNAWGDQNTGFYYVVVDAMLKSGFSPEEIGKIGGGNYLRIFSAATQ